MRGRRLPLHTALILVGGLACGGGPARPDPPSEVDFPGNFEVLWTDFDRTYPFFPLKEIRWDSVRVATRAAAGEVTTARAFFELLAETLLSLEDAHVNLSSSFGTAVYRGWYEPFPRNFDFDVVVQTHLIDGPHDAPDGTMRYGRLTDEVGYVHIPSWGGDGHEADIDAALAALTDVSALVVDSRDNGGGSDLNARQVAGRFTDQRRLFRRVRFRDGPEHDDYTEPEDDYLEPAGVTFDRPVVLLTNRRVASSGEAFVLAMRVLPMVTVVGDTTGGASANPALRTLPIGWRYTVSRWLVTTPADDPFEGVGLAPDHAVWISAEDRLRGRDTIVDSAVAILEAVSSHANILPAASRAIARVASRRTRLNVNCTRRLDRMSSPSMLCSRGEPDPLPHGSGAARERAGPGRLPPGRLSIGRGDVLLDPGARTAVDGTARRVYDPRVIAVVDVSRWYTCTAQGWVYPPAGTETTG